MILDGMWYLSKEKSFCKNTEFWSLPDSRSFCCRLHCMSSWCNVFFSELLLKSLANITVELKSRWMSDNSMLFLTVGAWQHLPELNWRNNVIRFNAVETMFNLRALNCWWQATFLSLHRQRGTINLLQMRNIWRKIKILINEGTDKLLYDLRN